MIKHAPLLLFLFNSEILSLIVILYYMVRLLVWLLVNGAKGGAFN